MSATTFRTEVACFKSGGMYDPYEITVIIATELGFTWEHRICPDLAPAGERQAIITELTNWAAEEESMAAAMPPGFFDYPPEEIDYFPTVELAMSAAQILDQINHIAEDLQAYHAPAECGAVAYRGLEAKLNDIMAQAINRSVSHAHD